MLTNAEFYANYADYSNLIDNMRNKLLRAIGANGNKDYSEQWKTIETLERLQTLYHQMYHDQQTIDNQSSKIMLERKKMADKILSLENQLNELKKNITL